jgi:hypothetical protein
MRITKPIVFLLTLFLFTKISFGYILEGRVLDQKGTGIPYATITVANTSYGTFSTLNGAFTLRLDQGDYILRVQAMGYKTSEIKVAMREDIRDLDIVIASTSHEIEQVVVGQDKSSLTRKIMTKAKEFRKENAKATQSFISTSYKKYSLTYGTIGDMPLAIDSSEDEEFSKPELIEIYSTLYYTNPKRYKEKIKAYRDYKYTAKGIPMGQSISFTASSPGQREDPYESEESSQMAGNSYVFHINKLTENFNLYQSSIHIPKLSATPYISPIGNANFQYYRFYLMDSYFENGKKIYRIKVTPKNSVSSTFSGTLLIEDESFALVGASLEVNEATIQFHDHFSFTHQYHAVDGQYVMQSEEYTYHTKVKKNKFAYGSNLILYSNTKVNEEISPKFMRAGQTVTADSAEDLDQDFWNTIRPKNLTSKEVSFIHTQDSVRNYEHSLAYIEQLDSAVNHIEIWDFLLSGVQHVNREKGTSYYWGSLIQTIRPFSVGGYRQAVLGSFSKEWTKANKLFLDYEVNYGFRNKNIKGKLATEYLYAPKKFGTVSLRGGDDFHRVNNYESIEGTFSRSNYLQKVFMGIGAGYELFNGFHLEVNLDYANLSSIQNVELAPWSTKLFGDLNIPKDFAGYQEIVGDIKLSIRPFQKYKITKYKKEVLGSTWPSFNIHYKKGINALGKSDVNYDFLELNVRKEIKLKSLGESKFEIYTGKFINDREILIADRKFFRASDTYFFSDPLRSFQYLGPTFITTNPYFQGHYLHQFNGFLLNKVPFVKKLGLQSLGGASILLLDDDNYRHVELYAGLARKFRIKKQLFKLTVVYVSSENSVTSFDGGFKIGLDFYDSYRKKWSY